MRWWYHHSNQYNIIMHYGRLLLCADPPPPRAPPPAPSWWPRWCPSPCRCWPGPCSNMQTPTAARRSDFADHHTNIIQSHDLVFLSADQIHQICSSLINCVWSMDHGDQQHCAGSISPHSSSGYPARLHSFAQCHTTSGASFVRRKQAEYLVRYLRLLYQFVVSTQRTVSAHCELALCRVHSAVVSTLEFSTLF